MRCGRICDESSIALDKAAPGNDQNYWGARLRCAQEIGQAIDAGDFTEKPKSERSPYTPNLDYPGKPVVAKCNHDGAIQYVCYDCGFVMSGPERNTVIDKQKCDGTEVRLDPSRGVFVCQKCSEIHESK
jgi:predicted RNA-binding Zn-ribbon protein involved in translation (DUF1610 family)